MIAFVALALASIVAASPLVPRQTTTPFDPSTCSNVLPSCEQLKPTQLTDTKCVDIAGAAFQDGTPIQIYDCNGSEAQYFLGFTGLGKIRPYTHPEFCLDAGENPADGSKVHLWTCFDGLPQQTWYYDSLYGTFKIQNTELCLDLTNGDLTNGNQLQVWSCSGGPGGKNGEILGNNNQVWHA